MKHFTLIIFTIFLVKGVHAQNVERIEICYIPFNVHIDGRVTPEFLETDTIFSRKITIEDSAVIRSFENAVSLVNLIPKTSRKEFVPYMEINVFIRRPEGSKAKDTLKKSIYLNSSYLISFYDCQFHRNPILEKWLGAYVFNVK
jgi:hypothetical protein